MAGALEWDERAVRQATRAARSLPADLRAELRRSMEREVASPVARAMQQRATRSSVRVTRAFARRGVAVKPGEEPTIVAGGPEPYGRTRMRSVVGGAEFGGGTEFSTYTRRAARRGGARRRASGRHPVRRRVAAWAGKPAGYRKGRFFYPTLEDPGVVRRMRDDYTRVLERACEQWGSRGR